MNDTDIAVKFKDHDHKIDALKLQVKELEEQTKAIQELTLSVRDLANNIKNIVEMQSQQEGRLGSLEQAPLEQWAGIRRTFINTGAGVVAGAFTTGILMMISRYLIK